VVGQLNLARVAKIKAKILKQSSVAKAVRNQAEWQSRRNQEDNGGKDL